MKKLKVGTVVRLEKSIFTKEHTKKGMGDNWVKDPRTMIIKGDLNDLFYTGIFLEDLGGEKDCEPYYFIPKTYIKEVVENPELPAPPAEEYKGMEIIRELIDLIKKENEGEDVEMEKFLLGLALMAESSRLDKIDPGAKGEEHTAFINGLSKVAELLPSGGKDMTTGLDYSIPWEDMERVYVGQLSPEKQQEALEAHETECEELGDEPLSWAKLADTSVDDAFNWGESVQGYDYWALTVQEVLKQMRA